MGSKGGDPRDAELSGRDALPRSDGFQGLGNGEVSLQVLECSSVNALVTQNIRMTLTSSWNRAKLRRKSPSGGMSAIHVLDSVQRTHREYRRET